MMRFAVLLSGFLALAANAADRTQLAGIHTVYLLPMGNGFDQYLANRVTNLGVFQVVTDPKKADAIFTDRLGASFESRLEEFFPQTPPEKPQAAEPEESTEAKGKDSKNAKAKEEGTGSAAGDLPEAPKVPAYSGSSRGRGIFFLVDTRTRNVVWSTYDKPKDSTPQELDRTAARISERLKRDIQVK